MKLFNSSYNQNAVLFEDGTAIFLRPLDEITVNKKIYSMDKDIRIIENKKKRKSKKPEESSIEDNENDKNQEESDSNEKE